MQLFTYRTFGDDSEEVQSIIKSISYDDATDPLAIVKRQIDWSAEGYTVDDEELDGAGGTRAELKFYMYAVTGVDQATEFATVYINGAATPASGIPCRFVASHHSVARFVRNVPRERDRVWECALVFKRPNGKLPIVFKWREAIQ